MFSIMALIIREKMALIIEKKLSRLSSRQLFFQFCHLRRRLWAIIENMISPDHVLFYNFFLAMSLLTLVLLH